jgi:NADH:ubiquinone oxidoreductase subunit C
MPTPVIHYVVQCQWPHRRGVWRTTIRTGNPEEARQSVETLVGMRHRARVMLTLHVPDATRATQPRIYPLAEWSEQGTHRLLHHSQMLRRVPGWLLGREGVEPTGRAAS